MHSSFLCSGAAVVRVVRWRCSQFALGLQCNIGRIWLPACTYRKQVFPLVLLNLFWLRFCQETYIDYKKALALVRTQHKREWCWNLASGPSRPPWILDWACRYWMPLAGSICFLGKGFPVAVVPSLGNRCFLSPPVRSAKSTRNVLSTCSPL